MTALNYGSTDRTPEGGPRGGPSVGRLVDDMDDPFGHDAVGDTAVLLTRRRLVRIAMVAAETGARFAREGRVDDATEWMLTPSRMFRGAAPIEACQDRVHCCRAVLAHGLGLDDDTDPDDVDEMIDEGLLEDVAPVALLDVGSAPSCADYELGARPARNADARYGRLTEPDGLPSRPTLAPT